MVVHASPMLPKIEQRPQTKGITRAVKDALQGRERQKKYRTILWLLEPKVGLLNLNISSRP